MKLSIPISLLAVLLFGFVPGYADALEVTFTGTIGLNIYPPEFPIGVGDPFSAVLTYDPSQPNLNTVPGTGLYSDYSFTVTVQTSGGNFIYGGPNQAGLPGAINVLNDVTVSVPYQGLVVIDAVGNGGSGVIFQLLDYSHTALSSDSLADVNWQNLFTVSQESSKTLGQTGPEIVLRASSGAVVVEGIIDAISVQTITAPTIPEPASLVLLGTGLGVIGLAAWRRRK